ncbi:18636_t:CDS:1, partial [Gigaspora margarita]
SNAITINRERRFGKLKENFQVNEKKSIKNHGEDVGKGKWKWEIKKTTNLHPPHKNNY